MTTRDVKAMRARRPTVICDGDEQIVELGGEVGLYIDLGLRDPAPMTGDWIATEAGSRYLVDDVRLVRHRKRHAQQQRYQLKCRRIPKNTPPPPDVHVIWLAWYPRGARR